MANQDVLQDKINTYNTAVAEHFQSPEVLATLLKTITSHNITIEDWNTVVDSLKNNVELTPSQKQVLDAVVDCINELYTSVGLVPTKVDKSTDTSILYGTDSSGNQTTYDIKDTDATAGSIPKRNTNGHVVVGAVNDSFSDTEAITKEFLLRYISTVVQGDIDSKVSQTDASEKVYGTDETGEQMTYAVDSDLVGDGPIVRRETGTGTVVVGTPTSNTHATTKGYVDDVDATKVDKQTTTGLFAYTHLGNTQSELAIATPATGDTIAKRESDGRLKVATPSSDGDATTKAYVDAQISTAISSGIFYKGSKTVSELNALDKSTLITGWMYNVTNTGILTWAIEGVSKSLEIYEGENVIWIEGVGWDKVALDLSIYDDKFISAGFFTASPYNSDTGEISFIYESDLFDMSYDSSTGILAIEAQ